MPRWAHRHIAWLLVGLAPLLVLGVRADKSQPLPAPVPNNPSQRDTYNLSANAPAAPTAWGTFAHFGLWDSTAITAKQLFTTARVSFDAHAPTGSRAVLAVRAQAVGGGWSEWQTDLASGGEVEFATVMQRVQYRVVLLGSAESRPTVRNVQVQTYKSKTKTVQRKDANQTAPTYRLRVTRQGMVGGRTANGHIITKSDVFVSLPSWSSLSSLGGHEYQLRLSANGKSVVAPVYDVGPWNHHDNFWDSNRRTYTDLPVGWPEDHAAYYEGYNGRMSEEGYVRFPTAVDIGDGAYWALGLQGAQATVDVTFLWLGDDPGPNPQPRNSSPSERPRLTTTQPNPTLTPPPAEPTAAAPNDPAPPRKATPAATEPTAPPTPTATTAPTGLPTATIEPTPSEIVEVAFGEPGFDANTRAWQSLTCGDDAIKRALPGDRNGSKAALWRPELRGGRYRVAVHIPRCAGTEPTTQYAAYVVHTASDEPVVTINQASSADQWVVLGEWQFASGSEGFVKLTTAVNDPGLAVWFDSVRWSRVGE